MKNSFTKGHKPFLRKWAKWALLLSLILLILGALTEILFHRTITSSLLSAGILVAVIVVYDRLRFESAKLSTLRERSSEIANAVDDLDTHISTYSRLDPYTTEQSSAKIAMEPSHEVSSITLQLVREQRYGLHTDWMNVLREIVTTTPGQGAITFLGDRFIFDQIQDFVGQKQAQRFEFLDLESADRGRSQSQRSAEWSALVIQPTTDLAAAVTNSLFSRFTIRWMPAESKIWKLASANLEQDENVISSLEDKTGALFEPSEYWGRATRYIAIYNLEEI